MKEKKAYRKIKKGDKFPELPKGLIAQYILRRKNRTFVFAYDQEKNYTFIWDRVSASYNYIHQLYRNQTDLNEYPIWF